MISVKCRTLELSPACFMVPQTGSQFQDWTPHIPYLAFLIDHLNPRTFVELGVLDGNSFFAACAILKLLGRHCGCFGIDTWEGEFKQGVASGSYSGSFYEKVVEKAKEFDRCNLLRKDSINAAKHFENGSVDLLHIDASHAFEDVLADFNTWLPKVSKKGLIIMHDALNMSSGVPDFLKEIAPRFPIYVNKFGEGLATIFIEGPYPEQIDQLHTSPPEEVEHMDSIFECLGSLAKFAQATVIREGCV